MEKLRVALAQWAAAPNDKEENKKRGLALMEEAARQKAHILLLPEMWSNGWAPPYPDAFYHPLDPAKEKERQQWMDQAVDETDDFVQAFRQKAQEVHIGVVLTYLAKGQQRPRNRALFIGRSGEILLRYDKVHTCDFSMEALLESGEEFKVCEFDDVKVGIMTCYDREYPESARMLMLKGAEVILVPNSCDMNPARLQQLSTRAFENMTAVAMANYPGKGWGQSCAFSPVVFRGEHYVDNTLCLLGEEETLAVVEFDMADIRRYREEENWGNTYRKVGAYEGLLDDTVEAPFLRDPIHP